MDTPNTQAPRPLVPVCPGCGEAPDATDFPRRLFCDPCAFVIVLTADEAAECEAIALGLSDSDPRTYLAEVLRPRPAGAAALAYTKACAADKRAETTYTAAEAAAITTTPATPEWTQARYAAERAWDEWLLAAHARSDAFRAWQAAVRAGSTTTSIAEKPTIHPSGESECAA